MLYFPLLSFGCLLLAMLPEGTWTGRASLAVVGVFYGLVMLCARWSRMAAWQQKQIVGVEEIPSGLASMDPSTFVPTYRGEQTWQWLLLCLPVLAYACWYYVHRQRNAALRRALAWLYIPYAILAMYGTENHWFPSYTATTLKPEFRDAEMTIPYK